MTLSAADLASLNGAPIRLQPAAFPNVYVRMDGTGVTSYTAPGGGKVNCQFGGGPYETFKLSVHSDGSISLESTAFANVRVRMDGTGVTAFNDNGSGVVNCQFGAASTRERFRVRDQGGGLVALSSVEFPNSYLRVDGSGVTSPTDDGGGQVNCQFNTTGTVDLYERFSIALADQRLDFTVEHQQQTNWCWSATSVSIARFYNPQTGWTQCSLVNAEFGRNDCCGAAASGAACNQGWWPDLALTRLGHHREAPWVTLTPVQLAAELANSTPVGARVDWEGGGAHAMGIRGRSIVNGVEYISITDPWYGDSDLTRDNFANRYQNVGTWTQTFKTKR
jgi:hypothetical protein